MKQRLISIAQVFIFILLFTLNFQSCQVNSNEKVNIQQVEKLLNNMVSNTVLKAMMHQLAFMQI